MAQSGIVATSGKLLKLMFRQAVGVRDGDMRFGGGAFSVGVDRSGDGRIGVG